ncbi:MAG: aromatic ring-hydroxylating dioxygenase subunit alpha [Burkholderiaceae bacterium]
MKPTASPADSAHRQLPGLDAQTIARWEAGVAEAHARREPPASFPRLPDLPAGRYSGAAFFELERDALFKRTWVYAGHTDQLPEVGSFFVRRQSGAPILVVRGEDRVVRAFYNTCRHRGAPVARADSGHAPGLFTCGYHGWTYGLDGTLKAVTDVRDFAGIDLACRSLVPVRCGLLGNFIFVCEDPIAQSLEDFLEPVARYFRHLPLHDLRLVNQRSLELAGNFKVVLENFLEAYHFRLLHQHTTHRIFDSAGTSIHLWEHGHSMMLTPNRRPNWVDPGALGMPEMASATAIERDHNPSYHVFPNMILPISASGMPCVVLWPLGIERTLMEVLWFAPDWGGGPRDPLWQTRIANFDRILDEDIAFVAPIQASLTSPGFKGVPLNYQERRIYHWHEELDRRIGMDRIPAHLRVAPVLAEWLKDN